MNLSIPGSNLHSSGLCKRTVVCQTFRQRRCLRTVPQHPGLLNQLWKPQTPACDHMRISKSSSKYSSSIVARRFVCRVSNKEDLEGDLLTGSGNNSLGAKDDPLVFDDPQDNVFLTMQNMAGKMQKKLETVGAMLNEANKARQLVEAKLVKTQEDAKLELAATQAQAAQDLERLRMKLEGDLEDTVNLYESKLKEANKKSQDTQDTLEAAIAKLEGELSDSITLGESLQMDLDTLVENFDTAAASATIVVEKRLKAAQNAAMYAKTEQMEAEIAALKVSLIAAETKAAEAVSAAETRLVEEVNTAVSEATTETELMAVEAAVAADAASKRALSVEKKLQHQALLLKTVRMSREGENTALKALEVSEQKVFALTNQTETMQEKLAEAQKEARAAMARARESEKFVEQKSKGLVERAERAMETALMDRDQAVKAALDSKESARSTITALTKRAEAAEGQLLWQEEVLKRCAEAEALHKEAQVNLEALEEEKARLVDQIAQIEVTNEESLKTASTLEAELAALQEVMDDRVTAAEKRAEEAVNMSQETIATTEANIKLQRESDLAKMEELQGALESSKKKFSIASEASSRNITALRKALSTVSACADSWRSRAQAAEERVEILVVTLEEAEQRMLNAPVDPEDETSELPKSFVEVFEEGGVQLTHNGRMTQNCSDSELRKLMARGPRSDEDEKMLVSGTWTDDGIDKDSLYSREPLDFKSAAGIVLRKK